MIENQVLENRDVEDREIRANEPRSTADLVNRPDSRTPSTNEANREPLFPDSDSEGFRNRWHEIQLKFVDEPRSSVEQADQLVASVIKRLAEVFAGERDKMEHEWSQGQDVSTEDLRQALRRYRSFFDRLLSV